MGALDDLIKQDNERQKGQLAQLIANDEVRDYPSQDPEIPTEEAPSFIGYDPSTKPAPEPGIWDRLKSIASDVMNPDAPGNRMLREERDRDLAANGGVPPFERIAEAEVANRLPVAGKDAGLLKRAAVEGAQAMGMNAGDQAGEYMRNPDEERDLASRARELGFSGLIGSGLGAATGKVSKWLVGDKDGEIGGLAKWAGDRAAEAKNLVTGMGVRDARGYAKMHGVDAIDDAYGKLLEKYSPSGITGKSSKGHLDVIQPELEAVGNDLQAMAREASVAPNDLGQARQKLAAELEGEGAQAATGLGDDEAEYANAIGRLQQRLGKKEALSGLPQLINEKSKLQKFGHSGAGGSVPEIAGKEAAAFGGGVLKDEVERIMKGQAPEIADRYAAQNQNFAELATLEDVLRNKATAEKNGGDLGGILANSVISGGLGAAAGGMAADDKQTGILGGGLAGFAAGLGLQGGATRTAIRQGAGSRLTDAGGNMLRGLEGMAGNVGDYLGKQSAAGLGSALGERNAEARDKPGANVAVAHQKVVGLLQSNPAALGGYASQLQGPDMDSQKVSARITNLATREPYFRELLRKLEEDDQSTGPSGLTFDFGGQ